MDKQPKDQIGRIQYYEEKLNQCAAVLEQLQQALDGYRACREDLAALDRYYGSPAWRQDFEDDEAGRLPSDLKRGVLSEDGVYNVLTMQAELQREMRSAAAQKTESKKRRKTLKCCEQIRNKKKMK